MNLPIKDTRFLKYVAQIDIRVQEVRVQRHSLLEVMNGQPYFALSIKYASQIAPSDSEIRSGLDGFQITSLFLCVCVCVCVRSW